MSKLKYLNGAVSVLKWAVLYPIDATNSHPKKILYFVWSVYFISTFVITVIQCVIDLATHPFDFVEQYIIIINIVIYVTPFFNFFTFLYYSKNMVALVKNINENFVEKADNGIEELDMEECRKMSDQFSIGWVFNLLCSTTFVTAQPLIAGARVLPTAGWFPYDYTQSPLYEISYLWQWMCQINLGILYGASDGIYPCMAFVIGHQFQILASNFKNAFYYAIWKCGVAREVAIEFKNKLESEDLLSLLEEYEDVYKVTQWENFYQIMLDYFKRNIRQHQLLLRYCADLNQVMELFLMTKLVAAFLNVVIILFGAIVGGDDTKFMGLCSYILFGTIQVFMYTYGGQILTENADFLWSLYDSPWYLFDIKLRKTLLIIHSRVSKTIYTKAGSYYLMSAPAFISFMRSIYSFATVLRQVVVSDKITS